VPWLGGAVALVSVLLMVAASVWAWPRLAEGVGAPQRDGSILTVPGWPFAVFMPVLLTLVAVIVLVAQPIRRRMANAANVPLWRTNQTNRWTATMALIGVSVTFVGLHALLLSLAADLGLALGLGVLAFCLGLLLIVLGNYLGKFAPLTDEQRAFFPANTRGFIDGYREGFRRTARRLVWPFIGVGILTCVLAFFAPWVAIFTPILAAFAMVIPLAYGLVAGIDHRGDTEAH
jgi:heme exporter protein D